MSSTRRLILGSGSPRRRELLGTVGIDFIVKTSEVDEEAIEASMEGSPPVDIALALARAKAEAVAALCPDVFVLGADTIVVLDGQVLGKPRDGVHAAQMLSSLSGRSHEVITAIALVSPTSATTSCKQAAVRTEVEFDTIEADLIQRYIATGEPMDKAGSYGIQGFAGAFVKGIHGSYSNVVGLPVRETVAMLREAGAIDVWP